MEITSEMIEQAKQTAANMTAEQTASMKRDPFYWQMVMLKNDDLDAKQLWEATKKVLREFKKVNKLDMKIKMHKDGYGLVQVILDAERSKLLIEEQYKPVEDNKLLYSSARSYVKSLRACLDGILAYYNALDQRLKPDRGCGLMYHCELIINIRP